MTKRDQNRKIVILKQILNN